MVTITLDRAAEKGLATFATVSAEMNSLDEERRTKVDGGRGDASFLTCTRVAADAAELIGNADRRFIEGNLSLALVVHRFRRHSSGGEKETNETKREEEKGEGSTRWEGVFVRLLKKRKLTMIGSRQQILRGVTSTDSAVFFLLNNVDGGVNQNATQFFLTSTQKKKKK